MGGYETILVAAEQGVAVVTVNRPDKLNALNTKVLGELGEALCQLEADASVQVVLLTGAGEKAFVAGADIAEMASYGPLEGVRFAETGQRLFDRIETFPKPVIAVVNGFALGGGCELAMACDFIYASDKARLGQPEINLGIIPGFGGTQRLARRVGEARAKELVLTGDMVGAEEALRIGLVAKLFPADKLLEESKKCATKMASRGAVALMAAKQAIHEGMSTSLRHGELVERLSFALLCATEDKTEGMSAFLEKRPPKFKGR